MFGAPRTGVHNYRVFDIAVVDYLLTVVVALAAHRCFVPHWNPFVVIFLFQMLGVVAHRVFCVRTKVDKMLFG